MKIKFSTFNLICALVITSASVARAEVANESDSLVLRTALVNMGATTEGRESEKASVSVKNLKCETITDGMISCKFLDVPSGESITLTQNPAEDQVSDLRGAINRITGSPNTQIKVVTCTWNYGEAGSDNSRCDY